MQDNSKVSRLSGDFQPLQEGKATAPSATDTGDKSSIRKRYNRQADMRKVTIVPACLEPSSVAQYVCKKVAVYCRYFPNGLLFLEK